MRLKYLGLAGGIVVLAAEIVLTMGCQNQPTGPEGITKVGAGTLPASSKARANIVVRARGVAGSEHIYVTVDGNQIADFNLTTSYANYSASTNNSGDILVCFDNDDGENLDVQIDYIEVDGSRRQAEDQQSNTGVWQNSSCGGEYSEMLHCEGCINFGSVSSGGGGATTTAAATTTTASSWWGGGSWWGSTTTTAGATTTTTTSGGATTTSGGGSNTIVVRARGTGGGEHIYVTVSGSQIGSFNLTTSYSNYSSSTNNTGEIKVCFDNDDGENMDVQIDYITVNGSTRQAEDQQSNTGVWQNSSCGGEYSEMLHCEGCINFGNVSGGGGTTTTSGGYTTTTTTAAASTTTTTSGGGSNTIVVRARGTGGGEHIYVTVSGSQIGSFNLTTSYSNYSSSTNNTGEIKVCFDNDDGENMDVQIDYITVNGSTRQAEDQQSNTGVWQNSSCGGEYSEMLHCEGCINFGNVSGGGGTTTTTTASVSTTTTTSGGSGGEVTKSGSTWTAKVGGSTVYTGSRMFDAVNAACNNMGSGTIHIRNSGDSGNDGGDVYAIRPKANQTLDFHGSTVNCNSNGDLVVVVHADKRDGITVKNLRVTGNPRYGLWFRGCSNVTLTDITMNLSNDSPVGLGIRVDASTGSARNLTINGNISITGSAGHAIETYSVDGVNIGDVTVNNTGGCGVLLNDSRNCTVGTVTGNRNCPDGGYATFRVANGNGSTRCAGVVSRNSGRGFFSVSDSRDCTVDYVDIANCRSHGVFLEDATNTHVRSGTISNCNPNCQMVRCSNCSINVSGCN
jgi:hypothetical protein